MPVAYLSNEFDIDAYLRRIHVEEKKEVSPTYLAELQKQHLLHIPFENLDIHLGVKIVLKNSFDKVVSRNRGGFCYELNSLFYDLLKALGFDVIMVSARVYDDPETPGPEFDHLALIVTIEQKQYLADVGFGEFAFAPLKIVEYQRQLDDRGVFFVEKEHEKYIVCKVEEDRKVPVYEFTTIDRQIYEFYEMLQFHQTSDKSHFTQKRICSLPTSTGRVTIHGNTLKIKENERVQGSDIKGEEEFNTILKEYFRIELE